MRCGCVRLSDLTRFLWSVEWFLVVVLCGSITYCPAIQASSIDIAIVVIDKEVDFTPTSALTLAQATQALFVSNTVQNVTVTIQMFTYSNEIDVMNKAENIFSNSDFEVVIDFTSDRISSLMYMYAVKYQKPLLFGGGFYYRPCDDLIISMYGSYSSLANGLIKYLQEFQWGTLAIVTTDDPLWQHVVMGVRSQLQAQGFLIKHSIEINDINNGTKVFGHLRSISSAAKGKWPITIKCNN